jgi:type IV secretory pathway TraG/TraD family ATPase VirD4
MTTRPVAPGSGAGLPPGSGLPLTICAIGAASFAALAAVWLAGSLLAALSGAGWDPPTFGSDLAGALLAGGPGAVWPDVPAWQVWTVAAALFVPPLAMVVWLSLRLTGQSAGVDPSRSLAQLRDLRQLSPQGAAERARQLRPSLADVRRPDPTDTGLLLGTTRGNGLQLRASWEDVALAVMAPRAGKTTALAVPAVLDAPGAVIATSNKADLWAATGGLRAHHGPTFTFDPQAITGVEQQWGWDPLAHAGTVEEARRLADHFVQEVRDVRASRDFWSAAAHDLLTSLLLAAAVGGRDLHAVVEWLNDPMSPMPAELLRTAGHAAAASSLVGRQAGAPETRDGIYETARTAAACLRDPDIMAWVTPRADLPTLDVATVVPTRTTVYLLSKDGAGGAAPLVAALTDRLLRHATRTAERAGGRLDPPLVAVLDEAANVCRISDLPDLYSHLGSRGIVPVTILQSYRQGVRVWGEQGMDALWSAATIKLIGAGIDDAKLAEDISRLVGDHDIDVRSYSASDRSTSASTSVRRQRILGPEDIRALPRGTALLLATGTRPALIDLQPWYSSPSAAAVTACQQQSHETMTAAHGARP